jgi:serine/threonine protein kinase
MQEAAKLSKCSGNPHIAKVEMPFKEGNLLCLPTEYLAGNSLADRAEPILLEETALGYIRQIGEALTIVHKQGLVHRDIRPANIFLRIRGDAVDAVLTNFELAIECDTELSRTREQELTDGFSPIELYSRGKPIRPYTDVYSLSATLYQLLTGVTPVNAEKRWRAENQEPNGQELVSPQVMNPEITALTTRAIKEGMAILPEKRPQIMETWLSMLKLEKEKLASVHSSSADWTKWQAIWGAVAAIVTLLVGVPAWIALRNDSQSLPENLDNQNIRPAAEQTN